MKSLFKLTAAAMLAVGLGVTGASAQDTVKFGVADESYPPFSSKDATGQWVGWEMDLMDLVCKKAGLTCELVPTAWDGIIASLNGKKIDVIWSSMSITAERKQQIDFTNMYYNGAAVLIGAKNGDLDITPAHLSGKTFGAQVATIHERYVQKYFVAAGATVKTYQTQDEATSDLAAGRVDYVQADAISVDPFLASDQGKACCEIKGVVPDDKEVLGDGVGGGVRKEDTALKDKLNAAISELAKSGEIATLTKSYPLLDGKLIIPTM